MSQDYGKLLRGKAVIGGIGTIVSFDHKNWQCCESPLYSRVQPATKPNPLDHAFAVDRGSKIYPIHQTSGHSTIRNVCTDSLGAGVSDSLASGGRCRSARRIFWCMSETFLDRPMFGVEQVDGNPHARIYHTRMVLTEYIAQIVTACEGITEQLEGVAEYLMGIRGVIQIQVERHKFTVVKSPMFGWDEIEPKIVDLLRFSKVPELLRLPAPGLPETWLSEPGDVELSGCSSVCGERLAWAQEAGGSNPPAPTKSSAEESAD